MRKLRGDIESTYLAVRNFDGSSKHRDARMLHELGGEFPISGDALALITEREPK